MDFATLLKFAHVFAAVLWVGGGFTVIIAGIVLAGRSPAETQLAVVRATVLLAPRLFIPASIFTLASGVTLLFVAGWGWQPFTVLGLAGVIFTAGFGTFILGPSCERAVKTADDWGATSALPVLRRTQRLAMIDYAVQFAIVFLMVVKPGWSDLAVFGGIGSVIVLAVLAALRPVPHATV
ncbi:DUF2269 family protein [Tabrizicola sp.]|uniref:DUF2269 family protein n=1 Tax=Tabrizicola sp. TaxID=2005166 RepID=UPI0035AE7DDD